MDDTNPTSERAGVSKPKRRPRETRELKVKYEVVVIDGEGGRKLHQIQSRAVYQALLWLAPTRSPPVATLLGPVESAGRLLGTGGCGRPELGSSRGRRPLTVGRRSPP